MPMIFKSIKLGGQICTQEDKDNEEILKVVVSLEYRCQTFGGGLNVIRLGEIQYEVEKDYWQNWSKKRERYACNYITKTHGLEI